MHVGVSQSRHSPSKFNYAGVKLLILHADLGPAAVAREI